VPPVPPVSPVSPVSPVPHVPPVPVASLALLSALLFLAIPIRAGAEEISFPEAEARVSAEHGTLRAARLEVARATSEAKVARGLRMPKVELTGLWARIDDPIVLSVSVPGLPIQISQELAGQNQARAILWGNWPIFTGGKIDAAGEAAAAKVEEARDEERETAGSLQAELVRRYYGLRLALKAREVRSEALDGIEKHLDHARRLEAEGLVSKAERLHAEVARADADRQLKGAEQDVAMARTAVANILSLDRGTPVPDPSSPLFVPGPVGPLEEWAAAARGGNPALGRVASLRTLAGAGEKAEKASWWPDVGLFGYRNLYKADLIRPLEPTWAFGVAANFSIFDGFAREARISAARSRSARVGEIEGRARRDVDALVEKKWRETARAREQLEALGAASELADENLRVRTRAFDEGFGTSLDVVDARLSRQRVRLGRLLAAYQIDVALAELLEACGQSSRFDSFRAAGSTEIEK